MRQRSGDGSSDTARPAERMAHSTGYDAAADEPTAAPAAGQPGTDGAAEGLQQKSQPRCQCPPTARCCCSWCCSSIVLVVATWLIVCFIGREFERAVWIPAEGTAALYATKQVCGRASNASASAPPATFPNLTSFAALSGGAAPIHCGECGHCSNAHDMEIYDATKDTLTGTATRCSLRIFTGGAEAVKDCFRESVGFTEACNDCWTANVVRNQRHCKFTCTLSMLAGEKNNDETGELTSCLLCDEKMCGPEFLRCAGANRRRAGITSDIQRRSAEVCLHDDNDSG